MSYSLAWRKHGVIPGAIKGIPFLSWKKWFKRSYFQMRLWYRLTGYVPERDYRKNKGV